MIIFLLWEKSISIFLRVQPYFSVIGIWSSTLIQDNVNLNYNLRCINLQNYYQNAQSRTFINLLVVDYSSIPFLGLVAALVNQSLDC